MRKTILLFSAITLILLSLFQLNKWNLSSNINSSEIIVILSALAFILIGYFLSRLFEQKIKNSVFQTEEKKQTLNEAQLLLSKREVEILNQIAKGLSNNEIAKELFISENTVKSHVSKIFSKLDAKRRTQAVQIAREQKILR